MNPIVNRYMRRCIEDRNKNLEIGDAYTYERFINWKLPQEEYETLFQLAQERFTMYNQTLEEPDPLIFSDEELYKVFFQEHEIGENLFTFMAMAEYGIDKILEEHFFEEKRGEELILKIMGKRRHSKDQLKPDVKNLINHVTRYGDTKPSAEQVEELYYRICQELISSVKSVEKREFKRAFENKRKEIAEE